MTPWPWRIPGGWRTVVWTLVMASLGAVLCYVPLFDLLSYEFSFAIGLAASFGAAHLAAHQVRVARHAGEVTSPVRIFATAAGVNAAALLVLPLALISINAARVKVCDYPAGLAFYLLLPLCSVLCATAVGTASAVVFRRGAAAAAAAFIVASLGLSLYRFWAEPPIFAFDPFGGYFPGSLYDEDVAVGAPLLWARLYHLTGVGAVVATLCLVIDRHTLRPRLGLAVSPLRRRLGTLCLLLVAATIALGLSGHALGFSSDAAALARELGGRRDTEHFTLIYPRRSIVARQIDRIARDHEFRYEELRRTLGVAPGHVTSYVFASATQKRRLMGAARVLIAKPWRREIYIQHGSFPHPLLAHELAHVFAGEFGTGPFRIARGPLVGRRPGVPLINVGLIEGVAEAAAWGDRGGLTLHQWTRALSEVGLRPPLARVFGLGFLAESGPRSYTVAGSFCRWLLETRGAPRLRQTYASGGDFSRIYGRTLEQLEEEWLAMLATVPLSTNDREVARDRFRRPPIFRVPCAHTLAVRRQEARSLVADGALEDAITELRAVCRDAPHDPDATLELAAILREASQPTAAARLLEELQARPLPAALRARTLVARADLYLDAEAHQPARELLQQVQQLPTAAPLSRATTARLHALADPRLTPVLQVLAPQGHPEHRAIRTLLRLTEAVTAAPDDGLGPYLLGRQLLFRDLPDEAWPLFQQAASLRLPSQRFRQENLRLLGVAAFLAGAHAVAASAFRNLASQPETRPGLILAAQSFLERIAFEERQGRRKVTRGPRPSSSVPARKRSPSKM